MTVADWPTIGRLAALSVAGAGILWIVIPGAAWLSVQLLGLS